MIEVKLSQKQRHKIKHNLKCKFELDMAVSKMSHWHYFSIRVSNSQNKCSKISKKQRHNIKHDLKCKFE